MRGGPTIEDTAEHAITVAVDTGTYPGRTIVSIGGELDMLTAPVLRQALLEQVSTPGADVAVDLERVSFLASTGLGVLAEAAQHATASGSAFRLICASRAVLRPLQLTGLDQVFEIHASAEDLPAPR